jgi:hypothetical protein
VPQLAYYPRGLQVSILQFVFDSIYNSDFETTSAKELAGAEARRNLINTKAFFLERLCVLGRAACGLLRATGTKRSVKGTSFVAAAQRCRSDEALPSSCSVRGLREHLKMNLGLTGLVHLFEVKA